MKVLIAYDGSANSESAVIDLQLAGLHPDTEALVLSVLDGRSPDDDAATTGKEPREPERHADAGDACERQLAVAEQGADQVRRLFPNWKVTAEVCIGSPAWEIIKRAEGDGDRAFDLVVVGSRGFGEFKRLLLGSVAHRVVTTLRGSVRVSRGRPDRLTPQPGAGVASSPRLVVGVDGSPEAHTAVEAVASRSWPVGTRVVVATFETGISARVSQWEPNTIWGGTPPSLDSPTVEGRPALRVVAEAAEFVRHRRPDLSVTTLVRRADPKYGLLEAAETWEKDGADCIFVGATGVRGIARFLLGSVSTTVAMNAMCSVEIVRRRT
jgi:nucleotide-binding universal stress UspA family protein